MKTLAGWMVVDEEGRRGRPTSAAGNSASVVLPQSHAQTAKKAMTGIVTLDGKAVDAVGQVDRVDAAHDDETSAKIR